MATDIERFVDAPGRDAAIKEVRRAIDAEGVFLLHRGMYTSEPGVSCPRGHLRPRPLG